MHIAIIGAGNVGRALGRRWLTCDHDVRFGAPDPASGKYADFPAQRLAQPGIAVKNADAIVLATPWPNTEAAIRGLGDLTDRIVVDCTNPLGMGLARDLGFQPVDAGPLIAARLLEPLAMLWIDQSLYRGAGQDFAFAIVRRK